MTRTRFLLGVIVGFAFLLRIYHLASVPVSLSWDEASLGYNAFAIGQTLHDEHGEFLPVGRFIAFGDYKPVGYVYTAVPFIKLLGLHEFSTRLPSAIAGTVLVLVTYGLVLELIKKRRVALVAALFVAISPWTLQFSRAAYEANLATVFSGTGIWLFLRGTNRRSFWPLLASAVAFALSMYTFNSHRIFVPLIVAGLLLLHAHVALRNWKKYLVMGIVLGLLVLPMVPHMLSQEGKLRFQEVSWMNDLAPIENANARVQTDDNSVIGKILHNRRVVYSLAFLSHYADTFSPHFLFVSGDVNPRLSIQSVGEMYLFDLPLLLLGIAFLVRSHKRAGLILFVWLLLAPIPSAFARETPHALRSLNLVPVLQIISACGLIMLVSYRRWITIAASVVIAVSFLLYLHEYYLVYPQASALEWQHGYKEMVGKTKELQSSYDTVSVTETYGRSYIYFLFYNEYSPQKYWESRKVDRDWFGFWYVRGFDKYLFYGAVPENGKTLYVRGPQEAVEGTKEVDTVRNFDNRPIFVFLQKQ